MKRISLTLSEKTLEEFDKRRESMSRPEYLENLMGSERVVKDNGWIDMDRKLDRILDAIGKIGVSGGMSGKKFDAEMGKVNIELAAKSVGKEVDWDKALGGSDYGEIIDFINTVNSDGYQSTEEDLAKLRELEKVSGVKYNRFKGVLERRDGDKVVVVHKF